MNDRFTIEGIELWTRLGVPEAERSTEQRVLVDLSFPIDSVDPAAADTVSIDYAHIAAAVQALGGTERKTVERLAEDIAQMVLRDFRPARVTVTVRKFPLPGVRAIALTIDRRGKNIEPIA